MKHTLTFGFALALAATISSPGIARAQQQPDLRFKTGMWPDGAVIGASLAAAFVPLLWPNHFPRATCSPCDPAALWSFDRSTIGPLRSLPDKISYLTVGSEAVMGFLFLAHSRKGQGSAAFWEDVTIGAQSASVAAATTEWLKVLFHRPRPALRRDRPGLTPRSVLEKLGAMQMIDVHLPTTDHREVILTRYTQPEPDQRLLLEKLKLKLPDQPPPKITAAQVTAK